MRKKVKNEEYELYKKVTDYLVAQYPKVIFHFDFGSGVKLPVGLAVKQKRINPECGYPDLFISEIKEYKSFDGYDYCHGLFIELKAEGKSPYLKDGKTLRKDEHIENQAKMLEMLEVRGYKAVFATGFDEAKRIIDDYLGG